LWGGGLIAFVAGLVAWRSIRKAERVAAASGEVPMTHSGPAEPIRPLGLIEPNPIAEPANDETGSEPEEAPPEAEAGR
jgi:hypothetical protein